MLQKTRGIVLRSVKYGETSLVTTIFTEHYGTQSYMVQGVRTTSTKTNRAGLLQPGTLLDLIVYQNPGRSLQRIKEFRPEYIYTSLQEEVVKNTISMFSVEFLLRLLPENAIMPEVFEFALDYFCRLDKMTVADVANFPLRFIIQCSRLLGYEIHGSYSEQTANLNLQEGAFTNATPSISPYVNDEDAKLLSSLLRVKDYEELATIELNADARFRLLDWYILFLQQHTQHLGNIKSLPVLHAILH